MEGYSLYTPNKKPTTSEHAEIVDFLFKQLDQYGDPKEAISACLNFAMGTSAKSIGGFAIVYRDANGQMQGATIVNETGMTQYIPENILVYIAVHKDARGKGLGKKLMKKAFAQAKGEIALHVEPDNPARYLYEKLGFTNKYLEMRYQK